MKKIFLLMLLILPITLVNAADKDIELIDDYDDNKQIVTFKDGSEHQLVECMSRVMGRQS